MASIPTSFDPLGTLGKAPLVEWVYTPLTSNTSNPELLIRTDLCTPSTSAYPNWRTLFFRCADGNTNTRANVGPNNNSDVLLVYSDGVLRPCSMAVFEFATEQTFRLVQVFSTDAQVRMICSYENGVWVPQGGWHTREAGGVYNVACNFRGKILGIASHHQNEGLGSHGEMIETKFFK